MIARLSFVIPALNEVQYISAALESIHSAMTRCNKQLSYEIIVVDDGSLDRTVDIARQHRARVIEVCKRNIAAVRNAGASEAQGQFLIFVDADTQVNHSLISETMYAMMQGVMWGTALATPSDKCPLWARLGLNVFNKYYVSWRKCAYGFFFFVNREAFQQVGGFPEGTREGEDMTLSKLLLQQHGPPIVLRCASPRRRKSAAVWFFLSHEDVVAGYSLWR